MSYISSQHHAFLSRQPIKLYMFTYKLLNNRNCFSSQKCAKDCADSDPIKSVENYQWQNNCCRQTAQIKASFDQFIFLFQDFRQVPWKNICRNNRKHAVVGKADTEAHQEKSYDKVKHIQWQRVWQCLNPDVVNIDHFSKYDSYHERKQVSRTERPFQNHQCNHK